MPLHPLDESHNRILELEKERDLWKARAQGMPGAIEAADAERIVWQERAQAAEADRDEWKRRADTAESERDGLQAAFTKATTRSADAEARRVKALELAVTRLASSTGNRRAVDLATQFERYIKDGQS